MVETTISYVIRPAVSTYDPDRFFYKIIGKCLKVGRIITLNIFQLFLELFNTLALLKNTGFTALVCIKYSL